MDGKEKLQILDLRRSRMLAAMGVQVWHLRPSADSAVTPAPISVTKVVVEPPLSAPEPVPSKPVRERAEPRQPLQLPVSPEGSRESAESSESAETTTPPVPLAFTWLKGARTMLLFAGETAPVTVQHGKDVLRFADWRLQHSAPSVITTGEFRWPQLLDTTTGTPARALTVFIEKHFPDEKPWFVVGDDVADDLLPWLRECLPATQAGNILVLQKWSESVTDAALKKQIWQTLKQIC